MIVPQRHRILKIILPIVLGAIAAGITQYIRSGRESIAEYVPWRDRAALLEMINKDWYWLIAQGRDEYSPEARIDKRSPSDDPHDEGLLSLKVMRVDKKTVGFVAYYLKKFYEGVILFLDVASEYRHKGHGERLLRFAVDDLKSNGARVVRLVTRVDNESAQRLYLRTGFSEIERDEQFVTFAHS